ncbi:MAG: hypothetical protein KBH99_01600, partial [Syntrophobacteraceae bacterium]|nr:hypothetical protein [Syntrophobacteraceae bacterium]
GRIPYEEAKATAFWTAALTLLWFADVPGAVDCLKKSWELAPSREVESLLSLLDTLSQVQDLRFLLRRVDLPVPLQQDFDEAFYLSQYPEVLSAVRSGCIRSGWEHFLVEGRYQNRLSRTNPWTLSFFKAPRGGHGFRNHFSLQPSRVPQGRRREQGASVYSGAGDRN